MNIERAIKVLAFEELYPGNSSTSELAEARQLGIEALKRELEYRESMPPKEGELLPGETKE